jgi:hypothetical protein
MTQTPEDLVDDVVDEATFIAFLKSLSGDFERERRLEQEQPSPRYGPGALGWQHYDIGAYLDAAAAWAEAWGRETRRHANPWRAAAEILLGGKHYE